jgi:hypothetical protein
MEDDSYFKNTVKNVQEKTGEITQELTENAKNAIGQYTSKITVVAGLIFVIILCLFVGLGLYWLISKAIFNQSRITVQQTKVPVLCNTYTKISIDDFNKSGNGKRRSYTFWIYINDMNKYSGSYKHVFHIGDADDITKGTPYVFLDKYENKLFIRFASTENDSFAAYGKKASVQNLQDIEKNAYMQQGIEIPYIPIQRWVHVAVVVNENSNGGTVTAYVDGELSKIVSTNDPLATNTQVKIYKLDLDKMGDLHVGGSFEAQLGPGFSGLISKVTMFNYDLNDRDVYNNYNEGPLDGLLASLGLANYGVRSPIYRIV